ACDFSGVDLERMVRDVLKHLPVTYAEHENWPEAFFAGLLSSSIIYTGFDKLKLSGPVVPYCRNGTRLVQVELATTGERTRLLPRLSWKTCNGLNGTFGTYTGARVTVTFEVVKPGYPLPRCQRRRADSPQRPQAYFHRQSVPIPGWSW
ncbi:hypothetical protein MTO96_030553, partial [Rhipicephalus appendiculatus]